MNNVVEIWKPIFGFEGLYEVSSLGRVKNIPHWVTRDYVKKDGVRVTDRLFVKEKILTPKKKYHHRNRNKGNDAYYLGFSLRKAGKYINKMLHKIIAEAFIPNPENKPCIDHINGDPLDNRIENLRWCTYKENNNYPIAKARKAISAVGIRKGWKHTEEFKQMISAKLKGREIKKEWFAHRLKKVYQYSINGDFIAEYESMTEASKKVGISSGQLSDCCRGKHKTGKGFVWSYTKLH